MNNKIDDSWIQTFLGKKIYPFSPKPEDIEIEDIAWSLSNICRYNGHSFGFYSVAEHSVYVSENVPEKYAMQGLFHDGAEAYIGDIATPIKQLFPNIKPVEEKLMKCICTKINIPYPFDESIKKIDSAMLTTESLQLMTPYVEPWPHLKKDSLDIKIKCLFPLDAFKMFMNRYIKLKKG